MFRLPTLQCPVMSLITFRSDWMKVAYSTPWRVVPSVRLSPSGWHGKTSELYEIILEHEAQYIIDCVWYIWNSPIIPQSFSDGIIVAYVSRLNSVAKQCNEILQKTWHFFGHSTKLDSVYPLRWEKDNGRMLKDSRSILRTFLLPVVGQSVI